MHKRLDQHLDRHQYYHKEKFGTDISRTAALMELLAQHGDAVSADIEKAVAEQMCAGCLFNGMCQEE